MNQKNDDNNTEVWFWIGLFFMVGCGIWYAIIRSIVQAFNN